MYAFPSFVRLFDTRIVDVKDDGGWEGQVRVHVDVLAGDRASEIGVGPCHDRVGFIFAETKGGTAHAVRGRATLGEHGGNVQRAWGRSR